MMYDFARFGRNGQQLVEGAGQIRWPRPVSCCWSF